MHFASNTSLTPLGVRLLTVSRAKLEALDMPMGTREPAHALRRGVLVREAVRSAWASVEQQTSSELTNWHATNALGLDTVSEDDEESVEHEVAEERWLEDVLANVEQADEPYWVEATVGTPAYEEEEYEYNDVESYTFPSQSAGTSVCVVSVAEMDEDSDYVDSWLELDASSQQAKPEYSRVCYSPRPTEVELEENDEAVPELSPSMSTSSGSPELEPTTPPAPPPLLQRQEYIDCEEAEVLATLDHAHDHKDEFVDACDDCETPSIVDFVNPPPQLHPPSESDVTVAMWVSLGFNDCMDGECEFDLIALPPPLDACDDDDDDECECRTPPLLASDYSAKELADVDAEVAKPAWGEGKGRSEEGIEDHWQWALA